jgi:hypothetical protein
MASLPLIVVASNPVTWTLQPPHSYQRSLSKFNQFLHSLGSQWFKKKEINCKIQCRSRPKVIPTWMQIRTKRMVWMFSQTPSFQNLSHKILSILNSHSSITICKCCSSQCNNPSSNHNHNTTSKFISIISSSSQWIFNQCSRTKTWVSNLHLSSHKSLLYNPLWHRTNTNSNHYTSNLNHISNLINSLKWVSHLSPFNNQTLHSMCRRLYLSQTLRKETQQ